MLTLALVLLADITSSAIVESPENILTVRLDVGRGLKRKLGYSEDALLNFTELASKYGYPSEEHRVVSWDGYIITLFRIPRSRRNSRVGPPVLMMHGITDSADTWIFPGPRRGLGYLISDAGYDIWCANYRGNKYSRRHVRLNPDTDVEYWKFSYDEMAAYDLPALLDYILELRGLSSLSYVGFSQGTAMFYAMGSYRPDYYKKVDIAISLAPVAWLTNAFNPYIRLITKILPQLEALGNTIGKQELFADSSVYGESLEFLCQLGKVGRSVCTAALFNVVGYDDEQLTDEMVPLIGGHTPCGASLQNLIHLGQGILSPLFKRYDRGARDNMLVYGSAEPPEYNVSAVSSPVALFVGVND